MTTAGEYGRPYHARSFAIFLSGEPRWKTSGIQLLQSYLKKIRFRFLKRVHRPGRRSWWSFDRIAVARGVAVGLFFGVLIPVAQIVFAISAAVALRANVLAAALSTLVTNPVTLPFVYLGAYRIGTLFSAADAEVAEDLEASALAAEQSLEVTHWPEALLDWTSSIALPFVLGLLLLAVAAALLGFVLAQLVWAVVYGSGDSGRRPR
jgi:uncharacterized protein (DUF2062 family)